MSKVGFPIRRSTDQRLFAPSRSLSQRTTSFFASYRQGIHQMPLSHLIALICNAHHTRHPTHFPRQRRSANHHALMLCALYSERPGPFIETRTEVRGPHKQTRSQSDQTQTSTVGGRSVQIARGTRLRLSPSLRCQISASRSSLGSERN
jgi:hypothetical protein